MSSVLKPGMRFGGRYVVDDLIAEGGMASIFRARDERARQLVAVKVLYPYYADNQVIRARFAEEGRIQQMLVHPNIVRVQEVIDDPLSIVMEHVDGPTLDDYLADQGQLDESEIIEIALPVMSALGLAHSQGIIHRDLKPSNILLTRDGRGLHPKVMDFGVAKVKDAKHNLTATGTTVGTLHYMSPEQIVGSKNIDGRADIYSLGVTLYKLVTGEVPFNAPTEFALMMAQVEAPPLPPSKLRPGIAPQLEAMILKAMEKKPIDRFQSIREFTTALLSMRQGDTSTVQDTVTQSISRELIEMAMAADEVAQDRTGEINLRVMRSERLSEALRATADVTGETTIESTMELDASDFIQSDRRQAVDRADSTVELSSSQLIRLATNAEWTAEQEFSVDTTSNAATEVLKRRIDAQGRVLDDNSSNITRPSRAAKSLSPSHSSDSMETDSMGRKLDRQSGRVVVLDHDANSRDMTAPKISEAAYQSALNAAAPKVVTGYNPADTGEKTFEKPNFRTHLPKFETAKSNDFQDEIPFREPERPRAPSGRLRPQNDVPQSNGRPGQPPRHGVQAKPAAPATSRGQASNQSGVGQRVDLLAQSAMRKASKHRVPPWLLTAVIIAAIAVVVSAMVIMGLLLLD